MLLEMHPSILQLPISTPAGTFDALAAGPTAGREVLLLHGYPQGSIQWEHQLHALAAAGHRAVAPDQRGYSRGVRPAEVAAYRMDELVGDVLRITEALGWERFDLVGHDLGGVVAWNVAYRYPKRLRSLTAVSVSHPETFTQALKSDQDQQRRSAYLEMLRRDDAEQAMLADGAAALRRMLARALPAGRVERYLARLTEPGALTGALNWYRANRPGGTRVGVIQVPTLYVWGTEDAGMSRAAALGTEAWVSGRYRFEALEGVSHWVPEEAADRMSKLLLEHLDVAA